MEDGVARGKVIIEAHEAERVGAWGEGGDRAEVSDACGLRGTVAERAFVVAVGSGVEGWVGGGSGWGDGGDAADVGVIAGDGGARAIDDPCDEAVVVVGAEEEPFCGWEAFGDGEGAAGEECEVAWVGWGGGLAHVGEDRAGGAVAVADEARAGEP